MQKIKLTYQSHDFFLEIAGFLTKNSDFGNRYLKWNRLFTFVMNVCGRKFCKKEGSNLSFIPFQTWKNTISISKRLLLTKKPLIIISKSSILELGLSWQIHKQYSYHFRWPLELFKNPSHSCSNALELYLNK